MVLLGRPCGRVGRRRDIIEGPEFLIQQGLFIFMDGFLERITRIGRSASSDFDLSVLGYTAKLAASVTGSGLLGKSEIR